MTDVDLDFSDLRATYLNCTLKRSPERSHTQGLVDLSAAIMRQHGVDVEVLRVVDHDIATGVYTDMTQHGWATDAWPEIHERVMASDILVVAGPIWLGDNSSVTKRVIERLYGGSGDLNDAGQYAYYGRVGGCLITGNEDGIKHCAQNVLYSLQHIGYTIPPQADAGWIGEAGPGPSYLDEGSGGPENDFTNRNTTFMTWNLMHLARMLKGPAGSRRTATSARRGTRAPASTSRTRSTAERPAHHQPCFFAQRSSSRLITIISRTAAASPVHCGAPLTMTFMPSTDAMAVTGRVTAAITASRSIATVILVLTLVW